MLAVTCLALNIYFEARGEPLAGQWAVAFVTLNRAKWRVENVCAEVRAKGQFSWVHGGITRQMVSAAAADRSNFIQAEKVAALALTVHTADFTHGATHYHASRVLPDWSSKLEKVAVIGNHIFYKRATTIPR